MPVSTKAPKMSTSEARSFERESVTNAMIAATTLRASGACTGGCQPYQDIYTYQRWLAQGFQVRRGEHGAKLALIIEREHEERDGTVTLATLRWHTTVFCRCQVDAVRSV